MGPAFMYLYYLLQTKPISSFFF